MLPVVQLRIDEVAARSAGHLISMLFPPSRATRFLQAMEFCEQAEIFEQGQFRGRPFFHAAFGRTPLQIELALAAVDSIHTVVGSRFFINGKEFRSYLLSSALKCVVDSTRCSDYRAHCYRSVTLQGDRYLFPCAFALRNVELYSGLDLKNPASLAHQVEAMAVKAGCEWCPRLDINAIRKATGGDVIDV